MRRETPEMLHDARPHRLDGSGCAFILDEVDGDPARPGFCDAPRQPGSAYCPRHHARCRLPEGSAAEKQRLREIEALATAVGGRQGRGGRQPPAPLLRRLARVVRAASCPKRSCIVLKRTEMPTQRTAS